MSANVLLWVIVGASVSHSLICMPLNVRMRRIANQRKAEVRALAKGVTGQILYALAAGLVVTAAWIGLFIVTGKWQFLFIGVVPFVSQRITEAAARQ